MIRELKTLDRYLTAKQCAEMAGVKLSTFTAYANRDECPAASLMVAGRRMWLRTEIEEWVTGREYRRAHGIGHGTPARAVE